MCKLRTELDCTVSLMVDIALAASDPDRAFILPVKIWVEGKAQAYAYFFFHRDLDGKTTVGVNVNDTRYTDDRGLKRGEWDLVAHPSNAIWRLSLYEKLDRLHAEIVERAAPGVDIDKVDVETVIYPTPETMRVFRVYPLQNERKIFVTYG